MTREYGVDFATFLLYTDCKYQLMALSYERKIKGTIFDLFSIFVVI